jgi:hypothetical protein
VRIVSGDLFSVGADAICIPTNGFIKANGAAVMGRGIAKSAANIWPGTSMIVGSILKVWGNHVRCLTTLDPKANQPALTISTTSRYTLPYHLVMFPVKPQHEPALSDKSNIILRQRPLFQPGQRVPGFYCTAQLPLIIQSAQELVQLTTMAEWQNVKLPYVGCGNGELEWEQVRNALSPILDDRFIVVAYEKDSNFL